MRPDSSLGILVIKVWSGRRRTEGSESLFLCRENKGLPSIRCLTFHSSPWRLQMWLWEGLLWFFIHFHGLWVPGILGPDVPVVVLAGSTMLSTEAPPLPSCLVSLTFSPDAKNKNLKSVIEWKVLHKNQLPGVITMAGMTFTSVTDFSPVSHFQITYTFNNICSELLLILFLYTSHSAIFHVIAFCYNLESHTHTESLSICNFCGWEDRKLRKVTKVTISF